MTFYKATTPDGKDFRTGTLDYAGALVSGEPVSRPDQGPMVKDSPSTYLSVSVEPGEVLLGGTWPCRLFLVEPLGEVIGSDDHPYKRCCKSLRVLEEVPAHQALGPNGAEVAAIIERIDGLTVGEIRHRGAAWGAARDAALATLTQDLMSPDQHTLLMGPWNAVIS